MNSACSKKKWNRRVSRFNWQCLTGRRRCPLLHASQPQQHMHGELVACAAVLMAYEYVNPALLLHKYTE